jgi:outer membrane phospholipase A
VKPASTEFFENYEGCRDIDDSISRLLCYDHLLDTTDSVDSNRFEAQKLAQTDAERQILEQRDRRLADQQEALEYQRLSSNEPNFFGYAYPTGDELGDEPHLEFYISQKYALVEGWFEKLRYQSDETDSRVIAPLRAWVPSRFFFIYNGLYDFYALGSDRYNSSPIISRKQNPGAMLEWDFRDPRSKIRLGYFHESNGQSLGPDDQDKPDRDELLAAQREFETNRALYGEDFALAQVSRGWEFWSLQYQKSRHGYLADFDPEWYQLQAELRFFSDGQLFGGSREDAIWWEPENDAKIEDYDGVRVLAERSFGSVGFPLLGRIEYKGGVSSFDALGNASWKLSLGIKALNTRFTAFYFNGYGRDPSTYHLRTEYLGLGLEFR